MFGAPSEITQRISKVYADILPRLEDIGSRIENHSIILTILIVWNIILTIRLLMGGG